MWALTEFAETILAFNEMENKAKKTKYHSERGFNFTGLFDNTVQLG